MTRHQTIRHEFVEYVPSLLEEGVLYISIPYATATHRCLCGCGNEIVTPLSPTDWSLVFDGVSVSLDPSIGNWSLACESHYWIERNRVRWAPKWSREQIREGREQDSRAKYTYYRSVEEQRDDAPQTLSLWQRVKKWWS